MPPYLKRQKIAWKRPRMKPSDRGHLHALHFARGRRHHFFPPRAHRRICCKGPQASSGLSVSVT